MASQFSEEQRKALIKKKQELTHHGTKGMKWGRRKQKAPSAKNMTTKDLSTKVNRMKLERDYNQMVNPRKTRAKKIGAAALTAVATTAVSLAVRRYASKGFDAIDKIPKQVMDSPMDELRRASIEYLKTRG